MIQETYGVAEFKMRANYKGRKRKEDKEKEKNSKEESGGSSYSNRQKSSNNKQKTYHEDTQKRTYKNQYNNPMIDYLERTEEEKRKTDTPSVLIDPTFEGTDFFPSLPKSTTSPSIDDKFSGSMFSQAPYIILTPEAGDGDNDDADDFNAKRAQINNTETRLIVDASETPTNIDTDSSTVLLVTKSPSSAAKLTGTNLVKPSKRRTFECSAKLHHRKSSFSSKGKNESDEIKIYPKYVSKAKAKQRDRANNSNPDLNLPNKETMGQRRYRTYVYTKSGRLRRISNRRGLKIDAFNKYKSKNQNKNNSRHRKVRKRREVAYRRNLGNTTPSEGKSRQKRAEVIKDMFKRYNEKLRLNAPKRKIIRDKVFNLKKRKNRRYMYRYQNRRKYFYLETIRVRESIYR